MRASLLLLPLVLAGAAFAAPPAKKSMPDITGVWTGKYVCGQGVTKLELTVKQDKGGGLAATFRFGPAFENPDLPKGSYAMAGVFDARTQKLDLVGKKWAEQPEGWFMVDLHGKLVSADRLSGTIPQPGCSWFELKRGEQPVA